MRWCSPVKRISIYARDSFTCVICGKHLRDNTILSLDHIVPRAKGGTNDPNNLVTMCLSCNSSKQDKPIAKFDEDVVRRIKNARRRKVFYHKGREMIENAGSYGLAMERMKK